MAALAKLLAEHKTALSAEFKSALTSLETKLDGVQAAISVHGQRLTSLEDNMNQVSDLRRWKLNTLLWRIASPS